MIDPIIGRVVLTLAIIFGAAQAQTLVVDGRLAGPVDTTLVPNTAYVSLSDAQNALGLTSLLQDGTLRLTRGADTTDLAVVEIEDPADTDEPPPAVDPPPALRVDGRTFVPIRDVLTAFNVAHGDVDGRLVAVTPRATLTSVESAGRVVTATFDGPVTWRLSSNPLTGRHALFVPRATGAVTPVQDDRTVDTLRVRSDVSGIQVDITATDRRAVATAVRDGRFTRIHVLLEPHETTTDAPPEPVDDAPYQLALDLDTRGLSEAQMRRWEIAMTALGRRLQAAGVRTVVSGGLQAAGNADARRGVLAVSDAHIWFVPSLSTPGEARVWRLPDTLDDVALPAVVRRADPNARTVRQVDSAARTTLERLQGDAGTDRRLAETLTGTLFERAGLLVGDVQQAPLPVLTEAAGRAVLIETAPDAVRQFGFLDAIESAVLPLVEGSF